MQVRGTRLLSLFTVAALTTTLAAAPAIAQSPERFQVGGTAAGLTLRLPGAGSVEAGRTTALSDATPSATTTGVGLVQLADTHTTATANAANPSVADPGDGQRSCATPALLPGLTLGLACSSSLASVVGGNPSGSGVADAGTIAVDGSLLADILVDLLLQPLNDAVAPIGDQIEAIVATIQDTVLTAVIDEVAAQCSAVTGPVPVADVINTGAQLISEIGLPIASDELAALGEPCVVLAALIADVPLIGDGELPDLIQLLADALRDALSDLELLQIDLGGSTSALTSTATTVTSTATADGLVITSPSLAGLADVLDAIIADALNDPFIQRLTDLLSTLDDIPALPTVDELLGTVLGLLDLPLFAIDEPLLRLNAASSVATATRDRAANTFALAGTASSAGLTFSSGLAELLGIDPSISVAAGQTQTIAEGTPLASTISVGDVVRTEDTVDGLAGGTVTVSGVSIDLLTGLPDGGIGLGVGNASATARGVAGAPATPTGTPNLPTTGGGMALLGLLAVGGAVALRRRQLG